MLKEQFDIWGDCFTDFFTIRLGDKTTIINMQLEPGAASLRVEKAHLGLQWPARLNTLQLKTTNTEQMHNLITFMLQKLTLNIRVVFPRIQKR